MEVEAITHHKGSIMTEEVKEVTVTENWRPKVIIIGTVLGALLGLAAAYLYVQNWEEGERPKISVGEGVKLGLLSFGLLRNIAKLHE